MNDTLGRTTTPTLDDTLEAQLCRERRISAAYRLTLLDHGLTPEQVESIARRAIYGEGR